MAAIRTFILIRVPIRITRRPFPTKCLIRVAETYPSTRLKKKNNLRWNSVKKNGYKIKRSRYSSDIQERNRDAKNSSQSFVCVCFFSTRVEYDSRVRRRQKSIKIEFQEFTSRNKQNRQTKTIQNLGTKIFDKFFPMYLKQEKKIRM